MTDAIHHSEVEFQLIRGDKPILRGTPDGVWVLPNAALIAERKFGFKPVQGADANLQLRCYITMVADVYPKEHYFGILCQPRISFKPHTVYYRRQDIERAREEIYAIYDACFAPDAPRRASVEGCQYCTAKAVCPEFREWIGDIERIRSSPVSTWTDAQMEMFETRRTMAQKFIEDTHKAIVAIKAANPERLPNFRLKEGASVRTVSDLMHLPLARPTNYHPASPSRVQTARRTQDASGNPALQLTCTDCLRAFSWTGGEVKGRETQQAHCRFCMTPVNFVNDVELPPQAVVMSPCASPRMSAA